MYSFKNINLISTIKTAEQLWRYHFRKYNTCFYLSKDTTQNENFCLAQSRI